MIARLVSQLWVNRALALAVYLPCAALLLLLGGVGLWGEIDLAVFLRDPAALAKTHPLTGLVSNLGALVWAATASLCFFSVALARARGDSKEARFFLAAGALTTVLLLDDMFMAHEDLLPRYLGLDQRITFGVYGVLTLGFLVHFRARILASDFLFLLTACGCFALSILLDVLPGGFMRGQLLFEDGFKLLGIAGWFAFYARAAYVSATRGPASSASPAG